MSNLPKVKNMDIKYAQSAVLTLCDLAFLNTGVRSEATPNTEMLLVTDVDLSILERLRHSGSVQHLRNRRYDVYQLSATELIPKH